MARTVFIQPDFDDGLSLFDQSQPLGRPEFLTHMDHGFMQTGNRQTLGFR